MKPTFPRFGHGKQAMSRCAGQSKGMRLGGAPSWVYDGPFIRSRKGWTTRQKAPGSLEQSRYTCLVPPTSGLLYEKQKFVSFNQFFFSFWMSKKDSHGRTWKRSWQVVFCKNYTWISKWFWEGCTEINLLFNSIFRKLLGVCWLSLWGGGIYSLVWTGSSPLLNSLNFSRRGLELVSVACWEPQLLDVASRACGGPTWVSAGNQESWLHRPCLSWGGSAVIL